MSNTTNIDQIEVDRLASFLEAAQEYSAEPFNGRDESRQLTRQGERLEFSWGDRFHLKSALVPFRRMWMPKEPGSWIDCVAILRKHDALGIAGHYVREAELIIAEENHLEGFTLPTNRLIDLWLNTVFAHGGIKGRNRRSDFEVIIQNHGHAIVEYAFRLQVWKLGIQFINIADFGAQSLLEAAKVKFGIEPSFRLNYAFGNSEHEQTKEGHVIRRRASTKYTKAESIEDRFDRILGRPEFRELVNLVNQIGGVDAAFVADVLGRASAAQLLSRCLFKLSAISDAKIESAREFSHMYSRFAYKGGIALLAVTDQSNVFVNSHGLLALEETLSKLRMEVLQDGHNQA